MAETTPESQPEPQAPETAAAPVAAEQTPEESAAPPPAAPPPVREDSGNEPLYQPGMDWYVLRVASNKEDQVRNTLERKVKIEGLDDRIGRVMVPTLKEKRMRGGQARVYERKLYPGYVFVEMATEEDGSIPEDVWFLVKETTGVGDFIGSEGKPVQMAAHDVEGMLAASQKAEDQPGLSGLNFAKGDLVKVTEGSFENFEGNIDTIDEHRGMVTVLLTIFGRSTPVEVEYWQLEKL
jgi:transcriptional antiterminator NusG